MDQKITTLKTKLLSCGEKCLLDPKKTRAESRRATAANPSLALNVNILLHALYWFDYYDSSFILSPWHLALSFTLHIYPLGSVRDS